MAGYDDTYQMIISTLMGRPVGTEIQPDSQQAYEINMLNYIRSLELIANGPLIGIAEPDTQPIQPNDARACYIAGVAQDRTVAFQNFRNYLGQPIQITNGQMEACLVILIWDTQYWSATQVPTNIISAAEQANFYYSYNVKKTYSSIASMNADSNNPIGTDGKYIQIGDIVSVVNSTTPSENGIYSYTGTDWRYQTSFNFQLVQETGNDPNVAMSQNAVTNELMRIIKESRYNDDKSENSFIKGNNLFDPISADIVIGRYVNSVNGNLSVNASYDSTGYIPVKGSTTYTMSYLRQMAWFDKDFKYISGLDSNNNPPLTQVTPNNAAYARCSIPTGSESSFIFAEGSSIPTENVYFGYKLQNGAVTTDKLQNGAVTTDKADFFVVGKNLFNPNDSNLQRGKYINSLGTVQSNVSYSVTGYIPIVEGQSVISNKTRVSGNTYSAQYDANLVLIAGSMQHNIAVGVSGASYVRFTINVPETADIVAEQVQVEVGTVSTAYVPYKKSLEKDLLPSITTDDIENGAVTREKLSEEYQNIMEKKFVKNSNDYVDLTNNSSTNGLSYPNSEGVGWYLLYKAPSDNILNCLIAKPTKQFNNVVLQILDVGSDEDITNHVTSVVKVLYTIDVTDVWNKNIAIDTQFYIDNFQLESGKNYGFGFKETGDEAIGFYSNSGAVDGIYATNRLRFTSTFSYGVDSTVIPFVKLRYADGLLEYVVKIQGDVVATENIQDKSVTNDKLAEDSVGTDNVLDASVTESKTIFFDKSKNLFDPNDPNILRGKYLSSVGSVGTNVKYSVTGYIPISEGQNLICNKSSLSGGSYSQQYDANKVYIPNSAQRNIVTGVSGCAFVRFTLTVSETADIVAEQVQVEVGKVSTAYVPYGFVLKEKYIPEIKPDNDICIPKTLYMLSGVQNDIFVEPLIKRWRPDLNDVRFSGSSTYLRRFQRVASINKPNQGSTVITTLVERNYFKNIKVITSTVSVGVPNVGEGEIPVQIIGDSFTHGAFFKDALLTKGYVPGIKMIGLRNVSGSPGQYDEGRGGWRLASYFAVQTSRVSAYAGFWQPSGDAKYWGSTDFWKLANDIRKNPSGGWTFDEIYNAGRYTDSSLRFDENTGFLLNPSAYDMMFDNSQNSYVIYNGSTWVTTSYESYTWGFDYSKYLSMWSFTAPLIVGEMLGLNDFRGASDPENIDFTTWNNQLETMIASYKSAVPNGKFVVMIPCSTCGVLNNAAGDYTIKQNACMWAHRKDIIENFDGRESEGIYVVDTGIAIDNEYGYNEVISGDTIKPYAAYTGDKNIFVQTGNPHPYPNYPTMGISFAAFIQKFRG